MDVFTMTGRKRETYDVQMVYSSLWECALGIAAVTNSRLIDTLEKPYSYWKEVKESLSEELVNQLEYVETNNTWKALLQLLHYTKNENIEAFTTHVQSLDNVRLKFLCLPFVGDRFQDVREKAAYGDERAITALKEITKENPFFPQYIEFISKSEPTELKTHLIKVMTGWYRSVVAPELEATEQILRTDYESKKEMKAKVSAEELVQWATGGIQYLPEPSVHRVLLIPQFVYRPWTIEADIEGTKVFYYPVANESIAPHDNYMPSQSLVLKHKALGDEVRLRMVKLLSECERSLQELTDQLDLGKSTIHHHLKLLRAAKIVETNQGKYSLNRNGLELLSAELEQYVNR
ncbi:ArsR/SmtB family transcription factor [Halalkalibacter krulwichiae]|uniref:Helix-turn-helix domain protein n=1 Tax=Halalkalibacter krulwichiae TaxID=199441 RepID=A0A1X9MK09_9BACI|nr:metalloregulator ArsR/SmtB family transcription factor [Halalkalibacter krulwichiae]ARK32623.1 Helix-turn-helix domain protein [Halalkalibacter krulwichiae]